MKLRRLFALALAGMTALGILTACGKTNTKEEKVDIATVENCLQDIKDELGINIEVKSDYDGYYMAHRSAALLYQDSIKDDEKKVINLTTGAGLNLDPINSFRTVWGYALVEADKLANGEIASIYVKNGGDNIPLGKTVTTSEYIGIMCEYIIGLMNEDCSNYKVDTAIISVENEGKAYWAIGITIYGTTSD